MDHYITGTTIKTLREQKKLTQAELGELLGVSPKIISKALGISFLVFAGGDKLQRGRFRRSPSENAGPRLPLLLLQQTRIV